MQIINHKNQRLTLVQKFFIEKSLELLSSRTIDSYRVRVKNPKTILEELAHCIEDFEKGKIKHFETIKTKSKDTFALVDDAISLLKDSNYLCFNTISSEYFDKLLLELESNNYKKLLSSLKIILKDNENYLETLVSQFEILFQEDYQDKSSNEIFEHLRKVEKILNILYTELIDTGFSKSYLYKLVYGVFVNSLIDSKDFDTHFTNFKTRILSEKIEHQVVFKVETSNKVAEAISSTVFSSDISIKNDIDTINLDRQDRQNELGRFKAKVGVTKFIKCKIDAFDHIAALKLAKNILAEHLDVINLGLSGEFLSINNTVLVIIGIDVSKNGVFHNNVNRLDGKYKVEKEHYIEFTRKLPSILNNAQIISETKEKIKSAIRYLRLGNESTEVEHKFINYWIGLEFFFSNYESGSTIVRLKEHFINAHSLAYVKRNVYSFLRNFEELSNEDKASITPYNASDKDFAYLQSREFYTQIATKLLDKYPLLAYKADKFNKRFFKDAKADANAKEYLKEHKKNLEIHFTRIYRLRNEIIHDAATNTKNEQIASNLRYYLTFILNDIIDFLANKQYEANETVSIDDYFILNEITLGNIEQNSSKLDNLLNVSCNIDFIS